MTNNQIIRLLLPIVRVFVVTLFTPALQCQQISQTVELPIRIAEMSLIVVPVYVNARGPFDFVLDTGSTVTMIDEGFALEMGLPREGPTNIVSVQGGETEISTAEAASVVLEGAEVRRLKLGVVKSLKGLPVKARGVLGEDFLRRFDVLIDYDKKKLTLMQGMNPILQHLCGEHVPLLLTGNDTTGAVANRLIVQATLPSLRKNAVSLLLDTGTNAMVLYGERLGIMQHGTAPVSISGNAVSAGSAVEASSQVLPVRLGNAGVEIRVQTLVIHTTTALDVERMLPASAFRSVYISHAGGYAIFDPIVRTEAQIAYYMTRMKRAGSACEAQVC